MNKRWYLSCIWVVILAVLVSVSPVLLAQEFDEADPQTKYTNLIKQYQYADALVVLETIPEEKRSIPEKKMMLNLETFIKVEESKPEKGGLQTSDDDVGPDVANRTKRYYRAAQKAIIEGQTEAAKDVLIYIQFIYPNHHKSKKLLEWGLSSPDGSYKVEDIYKKYLSRSNNYFYGGNYILAKADLDVLKILDKDNPLVYERLGSTYYMMNEKQKAIDSWTSALFVDPDNKDLKGIIEKTKLALQEEAKAALAERKKVKKVVINDAQVMGVYRRQAQAYEMAENLKKKGLRVLIEETDKGKWAVKVSREELLKMNQKGK